MENGKLSLLLILFILFSLVQGKRLVEGQLLDQELIKIIFEED